ncbi:MAG: hypothetical protein ACE5LF_01900 [Alphaproteobacteria bacterium]
MVDLAASQVKCAMIERAERRLHLVDKTKFEARSPAHVCLLSNLSDVIAVARVALHLAE